MRLNYVVLLTPALLFWQQAWCADVLQQLANDGEASNFLEMVYTAGLNETLEALGPVTLFAPNNQAFSRLTEDLVKNMRADNQLLLTVLENHIVMGKRIILEDLEDEELMLTTIGGRSLRINVYKKSKFYRGFLTVNGRAVQKADLLADNGVIHFISDVIYPPVSEDIPAKLASDGRFGTLLTAVEMAGLGELLTESGPFTVFAPTDEAFDRIPRDTLDEILQNKDLLSRILRRHVIIGRTLHARGISWDVHETSGSEMIATQVFKNGVIKVAANLDSSAFVQQTDLLATNGVIHVIDAVI